MTITATPAATVTAERDSIATHLPRLTLAHLDTSDFARIADRIAKRSDTELLAAFDKCSPALASAIASALPDLTHDMLALCDDDTAARLFVTAIECNVFRSLAAFPLASVSEVTAAMNAKPARVRSMLALPNKLALAIRPDNHEYRANDTRPANCSKFTASAADLARKNTRAIRSALCAALRDRARDEATRARESKRAASNVIPVAADPTPADAVAIVAPTKPKRTAPKRAPKPAAK